MIRPGVADVRVASTIRREETSQTAGLRKAAATGSAFTGTIAATDRPLRFAASPQVKLMRLIFKDFKKQLKNNQVTWQVDRYDWNLDDSMSPHTFEGKLFVDPAKFKKFSSLKIAESLVKNADGTLRPLEIKIWRAKSTGSLILEAGNSMIHSGTDMTGPGILSRIAGFGSNRTWHLLLKPLPFTIRDVRVNNIFDKLTELDKKGQLTRTKSGTADYEKSIQRRNEHQAIGHVIDRLIQQFSLRYGQEKVVYGRKAAYYTFNPIDIPDEMAKNLGLSSGKGITCDVTRERENEWGLNIEGQRYFMISEVLNPTLAKLNPFVQRRPSELPFSRLVRMVMDSPKYIKPQSFYG